MSSNAAQVIAEDVLRAKSGVTAIICAYNEEKTIGKIVDTVLLCEHIDEIIVIDDGSCDQTPHIVQQYTVDEKIDFIHYSDNRGKGYAMAEGILAANNEVLLFIDADLLNFNHTHIASILTPLLSGKADMVIGQPTENLYDEYFNPFKMLAGERALYKREILPLVGKIRDSRFGVETILNISYLSQKKKIEFVYLKGLVHPVKFQKQTLKTAVIEYKQATFQIVRSAIACYPLIKLVFRNMVS